MSSLRESVNRIKDGVPYDVVIESLLEAKKEGATYWRELLLTLNRKIQRARKAELNTTRESIWLPILLNTASEWKTTNKKIVQFLLTFDILKNLKNGKLTNADITKVYARLVDSESSKGGGSEEGLDAYIDRGPRRLRNPIKASKTTQRNRQRRRSSTKRLPKPKDDND